ncbi:MAG TPA: hypothetical protein DCE42_09020, partial [Myxococcales bacterium]|nr:hypothetical protein [Myxococcales bacterium]
MKTLRPLFGVLGVLGFLCLSFVWQACNTGLCEKDAQCSGGLRCIDGSCQLSNSHECWTDKDCEGKSGGSFRCQVEPISFRHFCVKIDDGTVPTACKSPCATNDDCK